MEPDCWIFDHLAVVVRDLAKGRRALAASLRIAEWTAPVHDEVNGVRLQFARDPSGMVYELLQPIDETSPVHQALTSRSAILNHVAYRVRDLGLAAEQLYEAGCAPAGQPNPAIAYGGARIQFFVSPLRFIIELIEAPDHIHPFEILSDHGAGVVG